MLVLTRKLGERISIGQDVEVVVLKVTGNRVRLGITAPTDVPIRRNDMSVQDSDTADQGMRVRGRSGQTELTCCAGV